MISANIHNTPFIIYIDDDPDDLVIIGEAIKEVAPSVEVITYENGKEALAFLEKIPPKDRLPSAIIVDLNMAGLNGIQILELIKDNQALKNIPVIIFTTSDHPRHREVSLAKGASEFLTKPYGQANLREVCLFFSQYSNQPPQWK